MNLILNKILQLELERFQIQVFQAPNSESLPVAESTIIMYNNHQQGIREYERLRERPGGHHRPEMKLEVPPAAAFDIAVKQYKASVSRSDIQQLGYQLKIDVKRTKVRLGVTLAVGMMLNFFIL